ncbi:MAG: L,D-transpeptidase family protein [Gaiellaceae bacterium]
MKVRRALLLAAGLALVAATPAHAQEPKKIADGVTIAGVEVGGMTRQAAIVAVKASFDRPLVYELRGRSFWVVPGKLGAWPRTPGAVDAALAAAAGTAVRLEVGLAKWRLKRWVNRLARRFHRPARDARIVRRGLTPRVREQQPGRKLERYPARRALTVALRRHTRGPVALPVRRLRASTTRWNIGPAVVIRRGSRSLYLYRGVKKGGKMRLRRAFRVAVGQPSYPTPTGRFRIVSMQRNPWWYPPNTGWASGASPIPPGPGNPLGTRWMGLSVGAVGIHGTYNSASIGGFASHGCVRMYLREAEWLFERVRVGTTVFVVSA